MITSRPSKIVIHCLLVLVGIVWVYPFFWMFTSSLKSNMEFLLSGINPIPKVSHWDNYVRAWHDANFSGYFLNTTIITISTVIIVVFLCAISGYALGRVDFPGRKAIMAFIAAIMFIPKGYTIIPLVKLIGFLGLANSLSGVILAESSGYHVLFILMFTSAFAVIPKELEEAATIDGCGFLGTFYKVMLPLSKPIMATTAIMQFIWTWSSFLVPLVLTINKPELGTLAVGMQNFVGSHSTDWSGMAAGATIALLPIMLIFIAMQRYFIEGLAGSVKQ
jgi:multiple sugar transport system permease protein